MTSQPRALSGIQPTGAGFHLGSYLGAVRSWAALQQDYEVFYFIADMHAITVGHDPDALRRRTRESAAELIAMGLDPGRACIFVQSHVAEHAQLAWVLGCLTGYGEASRMTQFKDKGGGTVGLFVYPVLQAADILLYRPEAVPVGEDQRQHLELTRTLAQRFNSRFGETFPVPRAEVPASTGRIRDLADPTRKMSKSLPPAGTLFIQDPPKVLSKKVRSAVTDTGREVVAADDKPGVTNLLVILSALTGRAVPTLQDDFAGRGYGDLKKEVAEALVEFVGPFQRRYGELLADPAALDDLLARGADRARAVAADTLAAVYDRVGFLPPRVPAAR